MTDIKNANTTVIVSEPIAEWIQSQYVNGLILENFEIQE